MKDKKCCIIISSKDQCGINGQGINNFNRTAINLLKKIFL